MIFEIEYGRIETNVGLADSLFSDEENPLPGGGRDPPVRSSTMRQQLCRALVLSVLVAVPADAQQPTPAERWAASDRALAASQRLETPVQVWWTSDGCRGERSGCTPGCARDPARNQSLGRWYGPTLIPR